MRTPFRKSHGKITFVLYNRPSPCGGHCLYCFSVPGFTKSTTSNEDTMLARNCNWNGCKQLAQRYRIYNLQFGVGNKCDLAIKGDSFANHEPEYLKQYFKEVFDFLNGRPSDSLKEAKLYQKNGADRCVSIKVETRPDQIDEKKCKLFTELGITTVELGVQSLNDHILEINKRGHDSSSVELATKLLRERGFEIGYQVMVGLPGSILDNDMEMLTEKLWENCYSPDTLKIYPCLLLKDMVANQKRLLQLYEKGKWQPLNNEHYKELLFESFPRIPRYVHINRIQRIIDPKKIKIGVTDEIDRRVFSNVNKCLWQRSVSQMTNNLNGNFQNYEVINYKQGENRYCFQALFSEDIVLGYGRLDILPTKEALIRDVRVLGNMLTVGEKNILKTGCQHIGIGTSLVKEMEKVTLLSGIHKIIIKPAFGVFGWFEKLGYEEYNEYYMKKELRSMKAEHRF